MSNPHNLFSLRSVLEKEKIEWVEFPRMVSKSENCSQTREKGLCP
ncbi:unnamed protein product [Arabidopsis halleri]